MRIEKPIGRGEIPEINVKKSSCAQQGYLTRGMQVTHRNASILHALGRVPPANCSKYRDFSGASRPYRWWFVLLILLSGCRLLSPAYTDNSTATLLMLEAPEIHPAGEPLTLAATLDSDADEVVSQLTLLGSYGIWRYEGVPQSDQIIFDIPAADTQQAGMVTAIIQIEGQTAQSEFEIIPGQAVEPITPLVGPNSITADGESWSIAAVIPFDQFANPLVDGTAVKFQVAHPADSVETLETETKSLVAWERITSQTIAGKTFISAQADGAFGPEVEILETADWPTSFTLSNEPKLIAADGKQLTEIRTTRIVDQNGNVIPDGTMVQFIVSDAEGNSRTLPTQTVDGIAKLPLQAPLAPDPLTIIATIFAVKSEPLIIEFIQGKAVQPFTIKLDVTPGAEQFEGAMTLTAGPLLGTRGQHLPDGTPIQFELLKDGDLLIQTEVDSEDGLAIFAIRKAELTSGRYTAVATVGQVYAQTKFEIEK